MQTFLSNVIDSVLLENKELSSCTFILPSKRAGVFLKHELKKKLNHTLIFPTIISIEDFIGELSSLSLLDNTTLLFEFYTVYLNNTPKKEIDDFETFTKWAITALQDFNEIDRHLIDAAHVFNYLNDIDQLERWALEKNDTTTIIKNYLYFFQRLATYYTELNKALLIKQQGYQGLMYREAVDSLQNYIESNKEAQLLFVGFNALNKAEEVIFQELLENDIATIYWDADSYYFENNQASHFLKKYKRTWKYYQDHPFNWIQSHFNSAKTIHVVGTPKNNTQLKYVGELLSKNPNSNFQNTALVLADESLLPLALNSLPKEVGSINITMGYELTNMPISQLFNALLKLHIKAKKGKSSNLFYYKDIIQVLNHPLLKRTFHTESIISQILQNNYVFIDSHKLSTLFLEQGTPYEKVHFLFDNWNDDVHTALEKNIKLINLLKDTTSNTLEKEFLFKLTTIFQQLETLNTEYGYIKNIKTLDQFYNQLVSYEKLSFKGEPLSGLQLMGMLETRVLDFETVILTSVNEGVLPAGKSENSFIPFDVKKEVGLPTYQEKDAIFSYRFYRLIQRAKNVYLLYNTENDQYGSGEQSRFITQLEINSPECIQKYIVSPKLIASTIELKQIHKTSEVLAALKNLALKGFSPTALTTYIYNPIDFYQQKVLGVRESDEIEETVAANTLGTIIHKSLEAFYEPFKGVFLTKDAVVGMKKKTPLEVKKWFQKEYKNGDITSGKNLLIYTVAQQFILNFLDTELAILNQGKQLKILELEHSLNGSVHVDGIDFPIQLRGEADRIDELDGVLRIVDYKTGNVTQNDLNIKDWETLTADYKYSKSFQVLLYAYMYAEMNGLNFSTQPIESGIISFKNLKGGFLKVNRQHVQADDMSNFVRELKQLLLQIFNPDIPFTEKEDLPF